MNEYSILLLNKTYRQEAIQQAEALRLARSAKAVDKHVQPRRVNVNPIAIAARFWMWARQFRLGSIWLRPRPLALQNQTDC